MGGVGHSKGQFATQSVKKSGRSTNNGGPKDHGPSLEQELRESELQYRTLVETLPYGVIIIENGKIAFANETGAGLLGFEQAECLIGRDPLEFVTESEKDRVQDYFQRRIAGESGVPEQYESMARQRNGEEIPVEVRIRTFTLRGRTAFQLLLTDLTGRRRFDTQLRLLAEALEQIAEGMAIVDLENRLLFLNQYFAVMHGYRSEELVGRHLSVLYPAPELLGLAAADEETRRSGVSSGEAMHRRKDGAALSVFRTSSLIRNGQGSPVGTILTVRDISEFKASEQIAVHALDKSHLQIHNLEDQLRETAIQLEDSQAEKENYTTILEQTNEALKLVIGEGENRNREREQAVYRNLSRGVLPIVDQLKGERLSDSVRLLLNTLEFNLKSLFAYLPKALPQEMMRLTPQETRVCELIRSGLTSKKIADALSISSATVVVHRANIRKKLGLVGSDNNLATYLRSTL